MTPEEYPSINKSLEKMQWTSQEIQSEKLIKIRNFPAQKKVKLFGVTFYTNSTEYIATNDLNQGDTTDVKKVGRMRWKVE